MTVCHGEPRCNQILVILTCVVLVILLFLTAFGNIVTFIAFFRLKHGANNVFFMNLGFIYTAVAVLVQPFSVYLIAARNLIEPTAIVALVIACQFTGVIFETSIYLSLFSLTSVSLDRFAIVFFPLKYKCLVTVKKVYIWNTMCWISVLILIAPVAVSHGIKSSNSWVYSTDNSTTVCQGLYWFMESGSETEGVSYFKRHSFVHVAAMIYLTLCVLSLAPNLAVIVRLNQSMLRTLQRTFSKSSSQLSTQDSNFSYSDVGENDDTPDLISPAGCCDKMKPTSRPSNGTLHTKFVKAGSSGDRKAEAANSAKRAHHPIKSRSATAIPCKHSASNKKFSLVNISKSVSASALGIDSCNSKISPSLANLSASVFSPASVTGVTTGSAFPKDADPLKNATSSSCDPPPPIVRSASRQKFQATVRNSIKKVSNANTFIMRDQLAVKKSHQIEIRKKRQRSIVTTLIIMCLVCLMSSGLYGVAVFSVNLREHHHDSLLTMYVNFFAPFLMFTGMVTIPLIHYCRNAKLKVCIDKIYSSVMLRMSNRNPGVANSLKLTSRLSISRLSYSFLGPIRQSPTD